MINTKPAPTEKPILEVIKNRWSPLAFADKPIDEQIISSLLEAAKWAPSSFNEQPWQYIVGYKGDDTHTKLSDCLVEGNSWAKNAGVLMLSVSKTFFDHKHKPNRHHMHDVGMATMNLVLQATEMDLITHQMAGWDMDKARDYFSIPDDYEPGSMIAIGYAGEAEALSDDLKERQDSPRQRKNTEDLIWKS